MDEIEKISKFWDTQIVSQTVAVQRMKTCRTCPDFISLANICKNCGCYMPFKTKLKGSVCPKDHWPKEEPS
jgi:hypothetical protein